MYTKLIYEVGINHNGDIDMVKKLIDIAVANNIKYVKFQKRDIDLVYSKEELDTSRQSPWGNTNREQKEGLELSFEDYTEIDRYCKFVGIEWFGAPWDLNSIEFLEQFDCPFLKIPSALITDTVYLKRCKDANLPLILSTGMSNVEIIDKAVNDLGGPSTQIAYILSCTSTYPSASTEQNLKVISSFRELYPWAKIGFSNHSPSIIYMAAAVALGAQMIEFHGTLDRSLYGSDQAASIEPLGVEKIVKYIIALEEAKGDGVKRVIDSEIPIMKKLRKV